MNSGHASTFVHFSLFIGANDVPQPDRIVPSAGGDDLAVAGDGDALHGGMWPRPTPSGRPAKSQKRKTFSPPVVTRKPPTSLAPAAPIA